MKERLQAEHATLTRMRAELHAYMLERAHHLDEGEIGGTVFDVLWHMDGALRVLAALIETADLVAS